MLRDRKSFPAHDNAAHAQTADTGPRSTLPLPRQQQLGVEDCIDCDQPRMQHHIACD